MLYVRYASVKNNPNLNRAVCMNKTIINEQNPADSRPEPRSRDLFLQDKPKISVTSRLSKHTAASLLEELWL